MTRVVLDTNVLVSALLNSNGSPANTLSLIINDKLKLLYDNRILFEYRTVLLRPKFNFKKEWVSALLDYFESTGEFINAEPNPLHFVDEAGKKFFEVAKTGNAKYLVTDNIKHYPEDTIVVKAADVLTALSE